MWPAGTTALTAAVVVPGRQIAEASVPLVVTVDGDVTVAVDGTLLSD
jgi:hypothetical protein